MINRLPIWFKQDIPDAATLEKIRLVSRLGVHTVCQEARCPNLNHCFHKSRLTFLILGDTCTRGCRFCAVKKSNNRVLPLDLDEPMRVARVVKILGLKYVVITSVTRDDLADGGAMQFIRTIELIHDIDTDIKIEVLITDFSGNIASLKGIIKAHPAVIAHNLETVKRLYQEVRPRSDYQRSLDILSRIKEINTSLITKSSLILGFGESEEEVIQAMEDLNSRGCDILTLGQYLAPSLDCYPVKEFVSREQFQRYRRIGLALGFKAVLSEPLVRSSYQAEEAYRELLCTIQ
jgi:lipoic acid synthetase